MSSNMTDPMQSEKCLKHGHFMHNLNASAVKSIFWVLFLIVLIMLTIATSAFTKSAHIATHIKNAELHPTISRDLCPRLLSISKEKHRRTQIRCIYVSSLCLAVAITCTVFEAFAASTLIFCHQLDMVFLYWSFWTLLQVGSTIAILGIGLAQLWSYLGRESLPVNVAIGTPVLIIAWLGVALEYLCKGWLSEKALKSFETFVDGLMDSPRQSEPNAEAENQASTSSVPVAELLGFTLDSRPIIAFNRSSGTPHPMARHLSTTDDGRSIYIYGAIPTDPIDADAISNSVNPNISMATGKMEQPGRTSRTVTFDCELEASSAPVSSTTSRASLLDSIRGERSTSRSPTSVGGSRSRSDERV
ncbi:uncharacterized protein Bfra_010265 [Botrytis fragariae]|uniref:Uncharacterized protein n=1 Tax=Botrytis fragariae TaxID=1964551 RepID=A0A8H6EF63_9HELO|nr:uncharacterized protein Bfra_010265 [Botrytis fragariae]KAF5870119.1 hypothetical protein Bfra_010265 [Botrytis fragariae]